MNSNISPTDYAHLFLSETPLIDVRAPVEFVAGSLPNAVNLPIMNNEERAAVGTAYKQQGREPAIALGHSLVSGENREEKIQNWLKQIQNQPNTVIYCFRGGLRSQITQRWLVERGVHRPLIIGGYKKARQFLRENIDAFSSANPMLLLSGPTGSAKTHLLQALREQVPSIDLESLARHRGSAFGSTGVEQPTQIDFENALGVRLLKLSNTKPGSAVLVEDESRLIGRCAVPESFFLKMRESKVVYVDEPFEQRVENIFQDYIVKTAIGQGMSSEAQEQFAKYRKAVQQISRKLGGLRTQEILSDMEMAEGQFNKDDNLIEMNKSWISKLLSYYYDPQYEKSWMKRQPQVVFRGTAQDVAEYLKTLF